MGFCSAVTLAFATIFSLAAVALLAIAFSTDNWLTIHVKRQVQITLTEQPFQRTFLILKLNVFSNEILQSLSPKKETQEQFHHGPNPSD